VSEGGVYSSAVLGHSGVWQRATAALGQRGAQYWDAHFAAIGRGDGGAIHHHWLDQRHCRLHRARGTKHSVKAGFGAGCIPRWEDIAPDRSRIGGGPTQ
jgi:hypothetical protein